MDERTKTSTPPAVCLEVESEANETMRNCYYSIKSALESAHVLLGSKIGGTVPVYCWESVLVVQGEHELKCITSSGIVWCVRSAPLLPVFTHLMRFSLRAYSSPRRQAHELFGCLKVLEQHQAPCISSIRLKETQSHVKIPAEHLPQASTPTCDL